MPIFNGKDIKRCLQDRRLGLVLLDVRRQLARLDKGINDDTVFIR
jgi:hypothetical protein